MDIKKYYRNIRYKIIKFYDNIKDFLLLPRCKCNKKD